MAATTPLSTPLSQVLVAFTIEFDNEFERRFAETGIGRRFGVSLAMWSNLMRFVREGIAVRDLVAAAGLPRARTLSTLGGMERWGYVYVGPATLDGPPTQRDGFGSARGLSSDWVVRLTRAGETAQEIWQPLFGDIEKRWEKRFGVRAIDDLRGSLAAVVARLDVALPEYVPIVGSSDGMVAGIGSPEPRGTAARDLPSHLSALLSQVLLAYTIDFERRSELSLPMTENFVRVLNEKGMTIRDLPLAAAVSKEATAMALGFLAKTGHVVVADKVVRLTPKGREVQKRLPGLHTEVAAAWETRFGAKDVGRVGAVLDALAEHPRLSEGLRPHPGGWRQTKRYLQHTEAMLEDPRVGLPRYPMVLHRGGWPDGS